MDAKEGSSAATVAAGRKVHDIAHQSFYIDKCFQECVHLLQAAGSEVATDKRAGSSGGPSAAVLQEGSSIHAMHACVVYRLIDMLDDLLLMHA